MNIVVLKGRLVRDSEIREFQGGGKVLSNAMALSRVWYDNKGNKHEETDFVDIKANNGTADFIAKWFKKGDGISIKGRLKQESWQDKDTGANRSRLIVVVEEGHFELGRAENSANSTHNGANNGGNGGGNSSLGYGQTGAPQSHNQAPQAQQYGNYDHMPDTVTNAVERHNAEWQAQNTAQNTAQNLAQELDEIPF